jgi:hypothetical protein
MSGLLRGQGERDMDRTKDFLSHAETESLQLPAQNLARYRNRNRRGLQRSALGTSLARRFLLECAGQTDVAGIFICARFFQPFQTPLQ